MTARTTLKTFLFLILLFSLPAAVPSKSKKAGDHSLDETPGILWKEPADIASRDLRYGSGGLDGTPKEPFAFEEEDLKGTNPKFEVRDSAGTQWKVKIGVEARAEVAASRIVWAAGYFTPDNYFLPAVKIADMPVLQRGQELVGAGGIIRGARFKRSTGIKRIGMWKWRENPFTGTRELNGLRVLMALINNIDLKDVNNSIVQTADSERNLYMVSDLGSSFSGAIWPLDLKGNLESYRESRFIEDLSPDTVDFFIPTGPAPLDLAHALWRVYRKRLRWIGEGIPRADARWMGEILSQLSTTQILDAFQYAGYTSEEAQGFADVLLQRIAALKNL